jgi:hypothetical protein
VIHTSTTRVSEQELREAAGRLAAEFADVPSGSVLRCLARGVQRARLDRLPREQLVPAGESIARQLLLLRRRGQASTVIPQPRRPVD